MIENTRREENIGENTINKNLDTLNFSPYGIIRISHQKCLKQ